MEVLKVKKSSSSKKLGKYIYKQIVENIDFVLQIIGAGALSQAMKGVIEANKMLAAKGIMIAVIPAFEDIVTEEFSTTGIRLIPKVVG